MGGGTQKQLVLQTVSLVNSSLASRPSWNISSHSLTSQNSGLATCGRMPMRTYFPAEGGDPGKFSLNIVPQG